MRRLRVLTLTLTASALLLAGCGGSDDTAGDAEPADFDEDTVDTVEVLAEDISFPLDVYETSPGTVGFVYENVGNIRHTLLIEDTDGKLVPGFELAVSSNGDVDAGTVDLEPGEYTLICDIPGHRPAGMVADLVVE